MLNFRIFSLLLLASFAFAYFSPTQLEILNLHYKIQPKDIKTKNDVRTFYSILSVKPSVTENELESAYRKLSRKWHPDKFIRAEAKERRRAERKFETLSLVISILRDVERRKSYDYFVKNGFPVWDDKKAKYIFKNRYKPNLTFVLLFLAVLTSIGQIILLKLNRAQKNKRVEQILRDVRWKADHMTQKDLNSNKIMELPDDYELNADFSSYSVDDKLVTYCGKVFIVKPDRSVLLYNDDSINVENEQEMNDLVKNIIESGHFNLYGFQKKEMNRKERRQIGKTKQKDSEDQDDVLSKLVQFKEEDTRLKITDLYLVKIALGIWNRSFGRMFLDSSEVIAVVESTGDDEQTDDDDTDVVKKDKNGNIVLPNGKVLHSRKK